MKVIVTGGAGFIGSALIRYLVKHRPDWSILNIDKLTYAGNLASLKNVESHKGLSFKQADICDKAAMREAFNSFKPDGIIHLAAESHVDRSIDGPGDFIQTNIIGTYTLLEVTREYLSQRTSNEKFRFHHVSTDEVFGSLGQTGLFREDSPYQPNSPYSASKASSDHLVRAWHETFKIPATMSNCSNNYGPYHFPEKLIPLMILNALDDKKLPVYGTGENVRDWLYVDDHAEALCLIFERGENGQTYNVGGNNEVKNIDVVKTICRILDKEKPRKDGKSYDSLISFVTDRPGHDMRYAIDSTKLRTKLGWTPKETFASGIQKTVEWYLANLDWCRSVQDGTYRRERLGVVKS